jgi:hypothetical protein
MAGSAVPATVGHDDDLIGEGDLSARRPEPLGSLSRSGNARRPLIRILRGERDAVACPASWPDVAIPGKLLRRGHSRQNHLELSRSTSARDKPRSFSI